MKIRKGNKIKLLGLKFERLTVIAEAESIKGNACWLCECTCGNQKVVRAELLRSGKTKSCGCLHAEGNRKTHGLSKTHPLYPTWLNMRNRCEKETNSHYKYYGGRGIKVTPEWSDFSVFISDMGEKPTKYHSLDRRDNDKDYCKDNCRWATPSVQSRNQGRFSKGHEFKVDRKILLNGESLTLEECALRTGINYDTLRLRLAKGWSDEKAVVKHQVKGRRLANGQTVLELAKDLGLTIQAIHYRLKLHGDCEKIYELRAITPHVPVGGKVAKGRSNSPMQSK